MQYYFVAAWQARCSLFPLFSGNFQLCHWAAITHLESRMMKTSLGMWQRQQKSVYLWRGNIHNADIHLALICTVHCCLSFISCCLRNVPCFSCVNQQCKEIWVLINTTILQGSYYWYNSIHKTKSFLRYLLSFQGTGINQQSGRRALL